MGHGFTGLVGATYTGTVESTIQWLASTPGYQGSRNFACTYNNGAIVSCAGTGLFPPVGGAFVQLCKSYNAGTTTPGGSGAWGCYVNHS